MRFQGINSAMATAYVVWRDGTIIDNPVCRIPHAARQHTSWRNQFLGSLKRLQIRAQTKHDNKGNFYKVISMEEN
jgi:hypothetical protein